MPDTLPDPDVLVGDALQAGPSGVYDVTGKVWPLMQLHRPMTWREWCGSQFPDTGLDELYAFCKGVQVPNHVRLMPGHAYVLRLARVLEGSDDAISGFFDLKGSFCTLKWPCDFMSWWDWIQGATSRTQASLWVTSNGKPAADDVLLHPGKRYVLRLRARLRGGGREAWDNRDKLAQHLQAKGVAPTVVDKRVAEIMEHIADDQLSAAYRSLEPWATLKGMLNNKSVW